MSSSRAERPHASRRRWLTPTAGLLVAALGVSACVGSPAYRAGRKAERLEDYDRAVLEYQKAVKAKPDDRDARAALERVRLRAGLDHFAKGRRLAGTGKLEEALIELQAAAELHPTSNDIQEQLRQTRSLLRAKVEVAREGKTRLQTLIEEAANLSPAGYDLPKNLELADSLVFRNASARDIFTAIGHFANINIVFDPGFRDSTLSIDLRNSLLEDALQAVTSSTRNFYRVTAQNTVTIVPDHYARLHSTLRQGVQAWIPAAALPAGTTRESFTVLLVGAIIGVHAQWRVAPDAVDLEAVRATVRALAPASLRRS